MTVSRAAIHLFVVFAAGAFGACSESQFGADTGKGAAKKEEAAKDDDENEAQPATDPAQVAGAYLTCMTDETLPAIASDVGVGCSIRESSGVKRLLRDDETVEWSLIGRRFAMPPTVFLPPPRGSDYHALTLISRYEVPAVTVEAKVRRLGSSEVQTFRARIIESDESDDSNDSDDSGDSDSSAFEPPTLPKPPQEQVVGLSEDFRLGDAGFDDDSAYVNCDGVEPQNAQPTGDTLTVPITVTEGGPVLLVLDGVCGVSDNTNEVAIERGFTTVWRALLPKNQTRVSIPGFKAEPGSYTLRVTSHPRYFSSNPDDRDNFVIRSITLRSTGRVTVGTPVVN